MTKKRGRPTKFPKEPGQERSMIRFQVSMPPAVYERLEKWRSTQEITPERSAVLIRALEVWLDAKGA
jgi:hypothetical protein